VELPGGDRCPGLAPELRMGGKAGAMQLLRASLPLRRCLNASRTTFLYGDRILSGVRGQASHFY
jgi:hypothetical protein